MHLRKWCSLHKLCFCLLQGRRGPARPAFASCLQWRCCYYWGRHLACNSKSVWLSHLNRRSSSLSSKNLCTRSPLMMIQCRLALLCPCYPSFSLITSLRSCNRRHLSRFCRFPLCWDERQSSALCHCQCHSRRDFRLWSEQPVDLRPLSHQRPVLLFSSGQRWPDSRSCFV